MKTILQFKSLIILCTTIRSLGAFVNQISPFNTSRRAKTTAVVSSSSSTTSTEEPKINQAKPRTGFTQSILNFALESPLWKLVLVPQARANIVKTAEANGIEWDKALSWIKAQEGPWQSDDDDDVDLLEKYTAMIPEYYKKEFHAYETGNLSWDAAFEQEIASRAVGARNFPAYGSEGEDAFRGAFDSAIFGKLGGRTKLTTTNDDDGIIVDLGCGTGTSTRRLAAMFPEVKEVIGIDLSPYFIEVGKTLLKLAPIVGQKDGGSWVNTIKRDERIKLIVADAAKTGLNDECVDIVNLGLVIHELPIEATCDICQEALRILKPGGQLFISEMDYDSPAFAAQRENALLFSLIRSTEPYLDVYADGVSTIRDFLVKKFYSVKITAATGRHYALVATKASTKNTMSDDASSHDNHEQNEQVFEDSRFDTTGNYVVDDTHLKTWESKSNQ